MLEAREAAAGYPGRAVLQSVSLPCRPGEVLALLGPNGCGKSTLLRALCGLHPLTGGEILLDGRPLSQRTHRQIAQKVAYLPQSRPLPDITAGRMVLHGRFPYLSFPRRYGKADLALAREALAEAGASELAQRSMTSLSGGQRQKVYLAMALAQDTETVLLDEPTTYLDIRHRLDVMQLARSLARQGKAAVLVLHDLCLAMRYADRVAVLLEGRVQALGTPEEVFTSGILERAFAVRLCRLETAEGWQYYYGD